MRGGSKARKLVLMWCAFGIKGGKEPYFWGQSTGTGLWHCAADDGDLAVGVGGKEKVGGGLNGTGGL